MKSLGYSDHLLASSSCKVKELRMSNRGNQARKTLNRFSIMVVGVFLALIPAHAWISSFFPYYREVFAVVIGGLFLLRLSVPGTSSRLSHPIVLIVGVWMIYLAIAFVVDPQVSIYGEDATRASIYLSLVSPKQYVIRNMLLYVPLFLLLTIRGISKRELKRLLTILVVVSPLALILLFQDRLTTGDQLLQWIMFGGGRAHFNDVPTFYSFIFVAGMYILASRPKAVAWAVILMALVISSAYIVLSTSRQSVVFCVLAVVLYLLSAKGFRWIVVLVPVLLMIVVMASIGGIYIDAVSNRYFSSEFFETDRWRIMSDGLQMLRYWDEWLIGRGLSSVIFSGPHNNYIRFVQRIGLIGMTLTFLPFLVALRRALSAYVLHMKRYHGREAHDDSTLIWFLLMALSFTIWHSLFSYPHEEAFNAPMVWLGLSLWMAFEPSLKSRSWNAIEASK